MILSYATHNIMIIYFFPFENYFFVSQIFFRSFGKCPISLFGNAPKTNMAARTRRSRPVVLRERNERGFALFLRNLKSVLNLLASADELETDVLIQTRSRLVDASGTLSFLLNDMSNGLINATGIYIPSNAIQFPMQHLKNSLTHIIDLLSSRIEGRNNVDFYDSLDISYSAPLDLSQTGRSRRRYEIIYKTNSNTYDRFIFLGKQLLAFFRLVFQPFSGDEENSV